METNQLPGRVVLDRPHLSGSGTQVVLRFDNDYGVSIVRSEYSYGGPDLYEIAVLDFDKDSDKFTLTYSTPVTDDVLGWQSEANVLAVCEQVEGLTR